MPFVFFACRTLTRDISSLTYTRTCWPRLLSPRRQRKGKNSRSSPLLLSVTLSVFTHFRPFPSSVSACSPSWDASGTPAPPLLRLPPRRRTDRPRGPGKQVPTLQAAPMPDARAEKKKQCHCSITSIVSVDHHSNHPRSAPLLFHFSFNSNCLRVPRHS